MKNKIALLLVVIVVFSSCTMQRRYHNRGFSIGWNYHSSKLGKTDNLCVKQTKNPILSQASQVFQQESLDSSYEVKRTYNDAFVDFLVVEKESSPLVIQLGQSQLYKIKPDVKILKTQKGVNRPVVKTIQKSSTAEGSGSGLRGTGVFLLIIGLIVFVFVSILIGLLIALMGLIFVLSGGSSSGAKSKVVEHAPVEKKIEYVEVLYLKNGSIIRGVIIEQIPNEQVKIQTSDGSVFVYTMDQVLKITKEPK